MTQDQVELPVDVLLLFRDVQRAHRNALAAALAERNLQDVGQPRILILLDSLREDGVNQLELAQAIHVSPPTMTANLKNLERSGYVTRQFDPKDARCKRVAITPKGVEAVERCREAFAQVDAQLFAGFTEEEVNRIRLDYQHMLDNLYAIGGERDVVDDSPLPPPNLSPIGKEGP